MEPGGRLTALRRAPQEFEPNPKGTPDLSAAIPVPQTEDEPLLPRTRPQKAPRPAPPVKEQQSPQQKASIAPVTLPPLRSSDPVPPPALSSAPPPLRREEVSQAPPPRSAAPVEASTPSSGTKNSSRYSVPLVGALLLVVGLFVWREQTRPVYPEQEALTVPRAVTVADPQGEADPSDRPSPSFRPSQVGVGPPAPAPTMTPASALDLPDTLGETEGLPESAPGVGDREETVEDDFSAQRAAVLERMSSQPASSDVLEAPSSGAPANSGSSSANSDPGGLFPRTTPPAKPAPVRAAPPTAPSTAAVVPPSAPKVAPAIQNNPADLFPIDEELPKPVRQAPPATTAQKPQQPQQVKAPAPVAPAAVSPGQGDDPYQIDEPKL